SVVPFDELRMEDVHTPARSFRCPVCEKILADKYMFRRHYMIHTGEKPYACPVCPYRTIQKGDLKYHILRRHHRA
ncbi:Drought induced 19 protein type zinc-binding domain, partial [Trinorchestia longiramus]